MMNNKLNSILIISLIVSILLSLGITPAVFAAAGDSINPVSISAIPTFECIGVTVDYSGDNNQNSTGILEYRKSGGSWKTAPEMYADRSESEYRGDVFWLTANTQYEIRVTLSDADGGGTISTTVTTRNDNPAIGTNNIYVATNGSDTTGNGSLSSPYRTIQKAADVCSPGSTILIRGGTYSEEIELSVSGTANGWITFMPYNGENVTITGNSSIGLLIYGLKTNYLRFKNLNFKDCLYSAIYLSVCHDSIIENCTFLNCHTEYGVAHGDGYTNLYGAISFRGNSEEASYFTEMACYNHLVQNCTVDWNTGDEGVSSGVGLVKAQYGIVVRNNIFRSNGYQLWDGVSSYPEDEDGAENLLESCDFYGNDIYRADDDGLQIEGGNKNTRIWDNYIEDCNIGIATCPVLEGPCYVFRNIVWNKSGHTNCRATKIGKQSTGYGRLYYYHNVFYMTGENNGITQTNSYVGNAVAKNNVVYCGRYVIELTSNPSVSCDFDYDYLYSTQQPSDSDPRRFIKWGSTGGFSLSQFQDETGQEMHGVSVSNAGFTNAANGDFSLQSNSTCIDKGVVLPGFNDANSPWPYNGSGPDIGAYEYGSGGPTADTSPPYTSGHNPGKYSSNISKSTNVTLHVMDSNSGVDQSSIVMRVEGAAVSPTISGSKYDYTLTYNPPADFSYSQVVNVTVDARDLASTPNVMTQDAYSFTVESEGGSSGDEPSTGISELPFRVNCGGADYTDTSGDLWHADQVYQTDSWGYYGNSSAADQGTGTAIGNTQDDRIYQTERSSLSGYRFDIDNGNYDISLLFAETNAGHSGDRVFDVTIEGQLKLDNLDIYSEVGPNTALIKTISNVSVTDGQLNITFGSYVGNPIINGIMIATSSGSNNKAPVAVSDYYSTTLGTTLSISAPGVLGNDYDANNDTLNANLVKYVTHGDVTINPNGSFIYIPDSGYTGTDSFTYRANDGTSYSNTVIVIISVNDSGGGGDSGNLPTGGDSGSSGGSNAGGGSSAGGDSSTISNNDTVSDETAITNVYNYVSSSGKFNSDIVANSNDANLKIYIPQNTIGSNNMGLKLMNIAITRLNQAVPSPPNDAVIIGGVYDLSPDGAKFSPTIQLSMDYSGYQIPTGVSEKNLVIGIYDWTNNRWQPIPSFVQYSAGMVTAEIAHFSTYAVLAYTSPADFDVTQITTSAESIAAGSDMDVLALVVNHGDLTDTCDICCMIDSVSYAIEEVTLDGGDSTTVTFKVTPDILGMHTIQIGLLESSFTVTEPYRPATFTTSSISISPSEIYLGETVEISTLVNNIGDLSGTYEAILKMDNKYIDSKSLEVSGGDSDIIIFTLEPKTEGEHAVNIGNKVAFFEVKSVADVDVDIINRPDPEIDHFGLTPSYDPEKGTIEYTKIDYQITNADGLSPEALLVLTVFHNSEVLEEKSLVTLNELEGNEISGSIEYKPEDGWDTGTYIFEAELKEPSGIVHSIQFEKFTLIEESITKAVSWGSLGIIIGGTLVVLCAVLAIVIYRRREMLRGYVE